MSKSKAFRLLKQLERFERLELFEPGLSRARLEPIL
jgi:hypothetical protein